MQFGFPALAALVKSLETNGAVTHHLKHFGMQIIRQLENYHSNEHLVRRQAPGLRTYARSHTLRRLKA